MEEEYPVKRRFPRVTVMGRVEGKIVASYEATLVNLSLGGALVEHSSMVRLGSMSQLMLPYGNGEIRVNCRVVRSALNRRESRGRDSAVIYQTGLEFLNPSPDTLSALEKLITASHPGSGATGPTTVTLLLEEPPLPIA
ncbi:MAG: PilZ domain-containing protein [candidate division NC10 bacterium]|nr:PilZ domain-containing protein [candidate division NC10 bacterium]MBI4413281.1 PilZ domain-containing protein [candidate division NC10 bacterium]